MSGDSARKHPRPDRVELFGFYFLGINPQGEYGFANAHMVAQHYSVTPAQVLRWLDELDLAPRRILDRQFRLGRAQADLMLDAPFMNAAEMRHRIEEILAEVDEAAGGRRFWEEE
jgi:hypothetical protein